MFLEALSAPMARLAWSGSRLAPPICLALLTAAAAMASFVFACATPFAAFAVIAAAVLPLRSGLLVVAATWIVNQSIGFGLLHYPVDLNTILWGVAIGIAALGATVAASAVLRLMQRNAAPVALTVGLIAAYAAYELLLYGTTPFLGGAEDFTAAIVGRIGLVNLYWTIGLVAAFEIVRLTQPALRRPAASDYRI